MMHNKPDSKVHGANIGPTWVLSAPDGPHVGSMNLAIKEVMDQNESNIQYIQVIMHTVRALLFCCGGLIAAFTNIFDGYFIGTSELCGCSNIREATLKDPPKYEINPRWATS